MKKIVTIFLAVFFLITPLYTYAQEEASVDDNTNVEETIEEKETLADTLQEETVEQPTQETRSFWTIFLSLLIPSFLIIIAYLIFKFFEF